MGTGFLSPRFDIHNQIFSLIFVNIFSCDVTFLSVCELLILLIVRANIFCQVETESLHSYKIMVLQGWLELTWTTSELKKKEKWGKDTTNTRFHYKKHIYKKHMNILPKLIRNILKLSSEIDRILRLFSFFSDFEHFSVSFCRSKKLWGKILTYKSSKSQGTWSMSVRNVSLKKSMWSWCLNFDEENISFAVMPVPDLKFLRKIEVQNIEHRAG